MTAGCCSSTRFAPGDTCEDEQRNHMFPNLFGVRFLVFSCSQSQESKSWILLEHRSPTSTQSHAFPQVILTHTYQKPRERGSNTWIN